MTSVSSDELDALAVAAGFFGGASWVAVAGAAAVGACGVATAARRGRRHEQRVRDAEVADIARSCSRGFARFKTMPS